MIKKALLTAALCLLLPSQVMARHSNYSPMAPRSISAESSKKDYSFGLTLLPGNSIDSIEAVNRNGPWIVNYMIVDRYFLRPLAHGYSYLPDFTQTGVHNFFANISDLTGTFDNLLLCEFGHSGISLSRFAINTTLGIGGLFDVATALGIDSHPMKMSTVMGRYGVDQGHYLMIPFMGPSTERELHGSIADSWPYLPLNPVLSTSLKLLDAIDTRAQFIPQEGIIDNAVDSYAQMRQIYLMYAQGKVDPDAAMKTEEDQNVDEFLDEIDE